MAALVNIDLCVEVPLAVYIMPKKNRSPTVKRKSCGSPPKTAMQRKITLKKYPEILFFTVAL